MTKWIALPAAIVAAAVFIANLEAAPNGNGKSTAPKTTKTSTKAPPSTSPKSTSTKADHPGASKAKGPKSTTSGTTTTAKGNGSSKKSSTTTASTTIDTNPAPGTAT